MSCLAATQVVQRPPSERRLACRGAEGSGHQRRNQRPERQGDQDHRSAVMMLAGKTKMLVGIALANKMAGQIGAMPVPRECEKSMTSMGETIEQILIEKTSACLGDIKLADKIWT
jgi:hypothetical protein